MNRKNADILIKKIHLVFNYFSFKVDLVEE